MGARLLTESFYDADLDLIHIIDDPEFFYVLKGKELVINSGLNNSNDSYRLKFVESLCDKASGLIMSTQEDRMPSQELIAYCNEHRFPLIHIGWTTSFAEMLHAGYERLINGEREEGSREDAFAGAIYEFEKDNSYVRSFESDEFLNGSEYTVACIGYDKRNTELINAERLKHIVNHLDERTVVLKERGRIIVLAIDADARQLGKRLGMLVESYSGLSVGIGSTVTNVRNIHASYGRANVAYRMLGTLESNPLRYDDLGIYRILNDVKDRTVNTEFAENILGRLINYDEIHKTDYMYVLSKLLENDCNATRTAEVLFIHRNTMKYKIKAIKEILGCDIFETYNRSKIVLAMYILKMQR